MKIDQISQLSGRAAGLLAKIIQLAPFLMYAELRKDYSIGLNIPDKSTFSGSAARQVGNAFVKDLQNPNAEKVQLASYGREVAVDNLYKYDVNLTGSVLSLQRYLDRQLSSAATKLGQEVQSHMWTGTSSSGQMLGLANFVKDAAAGGQTPALGFTASEQASMNTQVGLQLNTQANQDAFIEILLQKLAEVPGANAIVCNINLFARLNTIAKKLGAAGETISSFGVPVQTFNNIPLIPVGLDTISQSESDGTNNDCTSLYILRLDEVQGVCWNTNSGFVFTDFEDYQTMPQGVARLEINLNLAVERTDALRRLSRIRL